MYQYNNEVTMGRLSLDEAIIQCKEDIENEFYIETFVDFIPKIDAIYNSLPFHDNISDQERIDEYKYCYEQFQKYIRAREEEVKDKKDNFDELYKLVIKYRKDTDQTSRERKKLIYHKLRNMWLDNLIAIISEMIELIKRFKEEM